MHITGEEAALFLAAGQARLGVQTVEHLLTACNGDTGMALEVRMHDCVCAMYDVRTNRTLCLLPGRAPCPVQSMLKRHKARPRRRSPPRAQRMAQEATEAPETSSIPAPVESPKDHGAQPSILIQGASMHAQASSGACLPSACQQHAAPCANTTQRPHSPTTFYPCTPAEWRPEDAGWKAPPTPTWDVPAASGTTLSTDTSPPSLAKPEADAAPVPAALDLDALMQSIGVSVAATPDEDHHSVSSSNAASSACWPPHDASGGGAPGAAAAAPDAAAAAPDGEPASEFMDDLLSTLMG